METPLVTVLINNYNYEKFISQAIDSVLNQDYKNIEIIVVDDGSTDNSRVIISGYRERIKIIFKKNGGQASAFNSGFEKSTGDIVCFLDADDTFILNKISTIVNIFKKYPDAGWIFHELQYIDKDGECITEQIEERGVEKMLFIDFRQDMKKIKSMPYFPATTGLSFRANLLKKIFPVPEAFRISADSFLRFAALCQVSGVLYPENLATHRQHGKNLYVLNPNMHYFRAEKGIYIAYYLHERFPDFRAFTNRIYSRSVGQLISLKGLLYVLDHYETRQYLRTFFMRKNMSGIDFFNCILCGMLNFYRAKKGKI